MKKILLISFVLLCFSCSSYNSIDNFYEAHKNDNQVTAVRVPQFMFNLISQISPEMKGLVGNTRDVRYMKFPSRTTTQTDFLNNQMNQFSSNTFIEVYRRNDNDRRNVVSIRERRDVVKEILIYNNNSSSGSFLYFNGNFDPNTVRNMAKNNDFGKLADNLLPQLNMAPNGSSN